MSKTFVEGRAVEVGDDDSGQPRMMINTTRDELHSYGRNLAFMKVEVHPEGTAADIKRLRGIIARNARQRLAGEDAKEMFVTAQDIKDSLAICYEEKERT